MVQNCFVIDYVVKSTSISVGRRGGKLLSRIISSPPSPLLSVFRDALRRPAGIATPRHARFTYFGVRLTDNNVSPRFQRMAPLPWAEASWSWLSVIICFEKSTAHARESVRGRARIVVHTMQRAPHTESISFVSPHARMHARRRARTRTNGKIGDDCNFSQRRRSLREPLIIGPPGIYRVEGWSSAARLNFGYFSVVWCLLKWIFYCRLCHPRPLHSSARPRKHRAHFR